MVALRISLGNLARKVENFGPCHVGQRLLSCRLLSRGCEPHSNFKLVNSIQAFVYLEVGFHLLKLKLFLGVAKSAVLRPILLIRYNSWMKLSNIIFVARRKQKWTTPNSEIIEVPKDSAMIDGCLGCGLVDGRSLVCSGCTPNE